MNNRYVRVLSIVNKKGWDWRKKRMFSNELRSATSNENDMVIKAKVKGRLVQKVSDDT